MLSFFLGIISTSLNSFGTGFWKKALGEGNLSNIMFKITAQIISFAYIILVFIFFRFDSNLLFSKDVLLLIISVILSSSTILIQAYVMKQTKLSQLMPYDNLDNLFTVILGFILFYGTEKGSSITTLIITILTIFIIIGFSIDRKNLKIPKTIGLYILYKVLKSARTLVVGYILVKYVATSFAIGNWFFEVISFTLLAFITKDNFKSLINQNKAFYKNRFLASFLGWIAYFTGLLIIEKSGVIIATLLGFLSIVFNILTMKYMLDDTPT
ncbi:MAG: hypothetical protein PHE25_06315, partial [Candidatus Gracilibacteria bacterium]|nr:hypothetical protein [Candidatus Gracilibacteria bacterium]